MNGAAPSLAAAATLYQQGQITAAEQMVRAYITAHPADSGGWHLLAVIGQGAGRPDIARAALTRLLALTPEDGPAWLDLMTVETQAGDLAAALAAAARARGLEEVADEACRRAAALLLRYGQAAEALTWAEKTPSPLSADMRALTAEILCALNRRMEAQALLGPGPQGQGEAVPLVLVRARLALEQGDAAGAGILLDQALAAEPGHQALLQNRLMAAHYDPAMDAPALAKLHQRVVPALAAGEAPRRARPPHAPRGIGFLSPDLHRHPIGYFLTSFLGQLGRPVVLYDDGGRGDDISARLKAAAGVQWRPVGHLDDGALARQIDADGIGLLIDLAGHTAGNRMAAFAARLADVQATWLGYVGTTGLAAMDYLIADSTHVPPGEEAHYGERIARLPLGYACYQHGDQFPPVTPPPSLSGAPPVFGCFAIPAKINPRLIQSWARIMAALPGSRLILQYRGYEDPFIGGPIRRAFSAAGIEPTRIDLRGAASHDVFMAAYGEVDVVLDSFPYSGGLTTCEALVMGVPVVTFPGDRFAGRHAASHLRHAGLPEWVAPDQATYEALAVSLAQDPHQLARWRQDQRARVLASPLGNGAAFARSFFDLCDQMLDAGPRAL